MLVHSTRLGQIETSQEDVIIFPQGLIGFESTRHWVIIPDSHNDDVAWLQSLSQAQVALPLISPRKYAPGYRVGIESRQLSPLHLRSTDRVYVMCVLSKSGKTLTANLRSPLVINLTKRLACQVIASEQLPLALPITLGTQSTLKMAA